MKSPSQNISRLAALLLIGSVAHICAQSSAALSGADSTLPGMALIPGGVYRPLFRMPEEPKELQVKAFYLDTTEVTVADFLEFVRANPMWARSQVKRVFADESYLKNWDDDFNPGTIELDRPVTFVSWFAAKAYAQWRSKRLPTVAEWEHAAVASATQADGSAETAFKQAVLQWYVAPGSDLRSVRSGTPNLWGVYDLHGLVWEWVSDFNSALLTGDSRAGDSPAGGFFCGSGSAGAKDASDYPAFMRTGFRSSLRANYCIHNLGFRCAKDL